MNRLWVFVLAATVAVALGACAGPGGGDVDTGATPTAKTGSTEVRAFATVLERDDTTMLCLGGVAESRPPQCSGAPIVGWDWTAVEGEESAGGVTWGLYAVQGQWDGETFTVTTEPVPGALYDPMVDPDAVDPWTGAATDGPLSEQAGLELQERLWAEVPGILMSGLAHGRVVISVAFDDGSLQSELDERYGDDTIIVVSSLTPVTD